MKKNVIKIGMLMLIIINIFSVFGYCNMTVEAMKESEMFYNDNKYLFEFTQNFVNILHIIYFLLLIVIPIIMLNKKNKFKKLKKENPEYVDKKEERFIDALGYSEIVLFATICWITMLGTATGHGAKSTLIIYWFQIVSCAISAGIVYCILKYSQKEIKEEVRKPREIINEENPYQTIK